MSKRNNRQKGASEKWLHGGPDRIEDPRWNSQVRSAGFKVRLEFPWGTANRRLIKRRSFFGRPVE